MEALKPCHACGSDPSIKRDLYDRPVAQCPNVLCFMHRSWADSDDWNARIIEDALRAELAVYKREFGKHTMDCLACGMYGEVREDCPSCHGFNIESAVPLMESNDALFKLQHDRIAKLEAVREAAQGVISSWDWIGGEQVDAMERLQKALQAAEEVPNA